MKFVTQIYRHKIDRLYFQIRQIKQKRQTHLYFIMIQIKISVILLPDELNDNIIQCTTSRVFEKLQNKTIDKLGTISEVKEIVSIDGGKIMNTDGSTVFTVCVNVEFQKFNVGDIVSGFITQVTIHGFYVTQGKIEIFTLYDYSKSLQVGDKVNVKIIKVKFDSDSSKFIVLANLV